MTSIIIPAYKERQCLEKLLPEIFKHISTGGNQVIVVNDESGDGTYNFISNELKELPVLVLNRSKKLGLTSAIFEGLRFALYDEIIIMDADGQHPPRYLPQMIDALKTHNLVVGTRYFIKDASISGFSTFRIFGSLICNLLAWPLTGLRDSTSGFFGFRKSVAPNLFAEVNPTSFKLGFEYFWRMKNAKEVAYSFEHRYIGETKMSLLQVRYYIKQLLAVYTKKFNPTKLLQFSLVGISGVLVNLGILTTAVELLNIQYNLAGVVSFVAAVIWNYSWNKIWTFKEVKTSWFDGIWKFAAVAIIALLIKQLVMTTFVEVWEIDYRISALFGIVVAAVVNFYGNRTWTFKDPNTVKKEEVKLAEDRR